MCIPGFMTNLTQNNTGKHDLGKARLDQKDKN